MTFCAILLLEQYALRAEVLSSSLLSLPCVIHRSSQSEPHVMQRQLTLTKVLVDLPESSLLYDMTFDKCIIAIIRIRCGSTNWMQLVRSIVVLCQLDLGIC